MNKERLSDEIGKIDEDIIEEADKVREAAASGKPLRKRKPFIAITAGFVAVAAAITGIVVVPKLDNTGIPIAHTQTAEVTDVSDEPDADTTSSGNTASPFETSPEPYEFTRERRKSDVISQVSAVTTSGGTIDPDSELLLTLNGDVSEDVLRSRIRLSPQSEFTLTHGENGTYLLKAENSFERGSLVKLAVADANGDICDSWAFRTADRFEVKSSYPRAGFNGISVDSGVEFEFTSEPSADGAEQFFDILPRVDGRFEAEGDTLFFIPESNFKPNTPYSVTLKAGLKSADGAVLVEDYSFSFRTTAYASDGTFMFTSSSSSGFSETFLPEDQACIEIYCSSDLRNKEFETHLYRFADADEYRAEVKACAESIWTDTYKTDTGGLDEVFTSSEVPFHREGDLHSSVYVILPEQLAAGYYVADVSVEPSDGAVYSVQYFIQVSDISVYALSLGEENVFFVNDAASGKPASGAQLTLETSGGSYSGTVGSDGLAYIKTKGETGHAVLDIKSGTGRYIDAVIMSDAENVRYADEYYTYLYTDRHAYLPDDTINVWGVILPKVRGTALPEKLYLQLESETKPVTPAADGTFREKFTFRNHAEDWWNEIELKTGSDTLVSSYVSIHEYVKPTYILDAELPEYAVMPHRDPVPVTLDVTYYEGTPAENVLIKGTHQICTPAVVKTDSTGKAEATLKADAPAETWKATNFSASFEITGIENSYTYLWKSIPALYHDRMLEYDYDEDSRALTLHTYGLDLGKADEFFATVEKDEWGYVSDGDYEILKNGAADIPVRVKITRSWTEEEETGSYYDKVEKRTVKTYRYNYKTLVVYDKTVNTVNGTVTVSDLPTDPELGRYSVEFYYTDSFGSNITDYGYDLGDGIDIWGLSIYDEFYGDLYYDRSSSKLFYRLDAVTGTTDSPDGNAVYNTFSEDQDIKFRLKCSSGELKFSGKLLLAVYKSDFVSYKIYDLDNSSDVIYKATADCIPNARYSGAFFDGRHIYNVSGSSIFYDPGERSIKLTVSSDEKTYDAGETAELTVKAEDKSGKTVSGATVLLSLVDEAAFAIAEQNADPLGELYRFVYYPSASSYISYIQHSFASGSGGEKGGGGGNETRKDFKDTAYFASAVTDADGYARFTVKLPDNLTTWRATVLAVYENESGRLLAGKQLMPVVVTRPMFITPIMHSQFVVGDDVAVSAKLAGSEAGANIDVSITGNGVNETKTILSQQTANFGKLPEGEYTVRFSAESENGRDAVEMPVTVVETLLETRISREVALTELANGIKPTKYPVRLAFFNKEYEFSTDILYSLIRYYGDSLDSRFAAAYAEKELGFITDEELTDEFAGETADGYARKLPAAQGSAYLTALMAITEPGIVGPEAKMNFTYDTDASQLPAVCEAYLGLAALGEPVINEVKDVLAQDTLTYVPSGIYLSAALALCGDYGSAYDAYMKFVPEITVNDSDPDEVFAYVCGTNGEPSQAHTKAALLTSSILGLPEAEFFARYLVSNDPTYGSYALELAIYTKYYVPKTDSDASFTYKQNGSTVTVDLDKHHPTLLTFTEEQFAGADFTPVSGTVNVIAGYVGRVDENDSAPTISVKKTLSGTAAVGEEMTVTINTSPYCVVYDVIPSCARRSGSQGGQLIRLFTDKEGKATYKFTIHTAGEYVTESPVAYKYSADTWGIGKRDVLKVGGSDEV